MSTIGYESWAVDMADVGAIYPFQGFEGLMVFVGVVFWLSWHVIQFRRETEELAEAEKSATAEKTKVMIDRY